jgi:hypothetical protein
MSGIRLVHILDDPSRHAAWCREAIAKVAVHGG